MSGKLFRGNFYRNLIFIPVDFIKTIPNRLRFGCTIEEAKATCLKKPYIKADK
jgi:hypothetical protein